MEGLVHVSTISLSSRNMGDLKNQINNYLEKSKENNEICKVGDYYEPVPGYVSVDIMVYLPAKLVQQTRALESFESDEDEKAQIH